MENWFYVKDSGVKFTFWKQIKHEYVVSVSQDFRQSIIKKGNSGSLRRSKWRIFTIQTFFRDFSGIYSAIWSQVIQLGQVGWSYWTQLARKKKQNHLDFDHWMCQSYSQSRSKYYDLTNHATNRLIHLSFLTFLTLAKTILNLEPQRQVLGAD